MWVRQFLVRFELELYTVAGSELRVNLFIVIGVISRQPKKGDHPPLEKP